MKKLITTLGFILAVTGTSCVMAAAIPDTPPEINVVHPANIIKNEVCIESPQIPSEPPHCAHVNITVTEDQYACLSIASTGSVVELNSHGNGSMEFTCRAADSNSHTFHFDCGDGVWHSKQGNQFATYTCNYNSSHEGENFTVSCKVDNDDPINPSCKKNIIINIPTVPNCGNGIIEPGEDCDFTYMQYGELYSIGSWLNNVPPKQDALDHNTDNGYYCRNCKLIKEGNFVYEPVGCLYTDKPISVMNNEVIPFWWRLNIIDSTITDDPDECANWSDDDSTLIMPTDCHFAVYNGNHKQGSSAVQTFTISCSNENIGNPIYDYFDLAHETIEKINGASLNTVYAYTDELTANKCLDSGEGCEYGEYKLVLEKVDYNYCNTQTHKRGSGERFGAVCEVNAAITRPYIMQISTFGANPVGVSDEDFLYDFYDMQGNALLDSTDLRRVMNISSETYAKENKVEDQVAAFRNKYEKLAVTVDSNNNPLRNIFGSNVTIKKVPNQHIYFISKKGNNNTLTLTQDYINTLASAFTIFVDGMDVVIEGDVLQYAMIITNKTMSFKDGKPGPKMSCSDGGQVVQGLYVAGEGFKQADESLRNNDNLGQKRWCPWGGLHVKGALIGDGITNIMKGKRSQLNSWFNVQSVHESNAQVAQERRQKIIGGAAVLIEYSPSLWKTLPPGAEIFTESLEVYRK